MKVFICKHHNGVWLNGCSIVIAKDIEVARQLLDKELVERGLQPSTEYSYELEEISVNAPNVFMLFDGDY